MPRPSRLSTMTGTLNECSSRNSTVNWAPVGFNKTSSALSKKHKQRRLLVDRKVKWIHGLCIVTFNCKTNFEPCKLHFTQLNINRLVSNKHLSLQGQWERLTLGMSGSVAPSQTVDYLSWPDDLDLLLQYHCDLSVYSLHGVCALGKRNRMMRWSKITLWINKIAS